MWEVPLVLASLLFRAQTSSPLGNNQTSPDIVEFRTPYPDNGSQILKLDITGDLSTSNLSYRAQMDQIVGELYPVIITCKPPSTTLVATALMLRSYLCALSGSIFLPRPNENPENQFTVETEHDNHDNHLGIQVSYFFLCRIDEILSGVVTACSKEMKAETEEYLGDVKAAVAIVYHGMIGLQKELGGRQLRPFYVCLSLCVDLYSGFL